MNIRVLSQISDPVLIQGEPGTGKSSLALRIHNESKRSHNKFLQVNIAAISESIFESELFGHKRGSFTGASTDKDGLIKSAGIGTVFIDEIGELSLHLQSKLLTLLEEGTYLPVGSSSPEKAKCRFIFATNRDLRSLVANSKFREDLFHRIRTFQYEISPLRDLKNKNYYLKKEVEKFHLKVNDAKLISSQVYEFMCEHHWSGNYRELNQFFRYLNVVQQKIIGVEDLPTWMKAVGVNVINEQSYHEHMESCERRYLNKVFSRNKGKLNFTAKEIKLSKTTLLSKIKKYDINLDSYKKN